MHLADFGNASISTRYLFWPGLAVFVLLNIIYLRIMGSAMVLDQHLFVTGGGLAFFLAFLILLTGMILGLCTVLLSAAAWQIAERIKKDKAVRKYLTYFLITLANLWVFAESIVGINFIFAILAQLLTPDA